MSQTLVCQAFCCIASQLNLAGYKLFASQLNLAKSSASFSSFFPSEEPATQNLFEGEDSSESDSPDELDNHLSGISESDSDSGDEGDPNFNPRGLKSALGEGSSDDDSDDGVDETKFERKARKRDAERMAEEEESKAELQLNLADSAKLSLGDGNLQHFSPFSSFLILAIYRRSI